MNRTEVESIKVGQTGLYEWDRRLPVCRVEPLHEVQWGPKKGRKFRTVAVSGSTGNAEISFIVAEAA